MTELHETSVLARDVDLASRVAAYRGADVVLMLSTVDGVLGAPLEGARAGAVPVVMPAGDQPDFVRHGENGIVCEPDDVRGVARWLDHLARPYVPASPARAGACRRGCMADGRRGLDELALNLERLIAEPQPEAARWPVRLMADAVAGVTAYRNDYYRLLEDLERVRSDDGYRAVRLSRDRPNPRWFAGLRRAGTSAARAAKRLRGST